MDLNDHRRHNTKFEQPVGPSEPTWDCDGCEVTFGSQTPSHRAYGWLSHAQRQGRPHATLCGPCMAGHVLYKSGAYYRRTPAAQEFADRNYDLPT